MVCKYRTVQLPLNLRLPIQQDLPRPLHESLFSFERPACRHIAVKLSGHSPRPGEELIERDLLFEANHPVNSECGQLTHCECIHRFS